MDNLNSIRNMFSKLNTILNPKQKMGALCLFCVLIVGSVLELLGVTLVLPFVQAIVTPEQLAGRSDVLWIMSAFHVESTQDMVMIFAVLLVLVYFVKNAILIGVTYIQYDYATKIQMELGNRMLRAYVKRPYLFFTKVDSSEIIRGCSDDIVSVYWIIAYLTDFVSQCVVASVIGCYLIYTDPLIAITVILLMLLQILCITYFFKPATKRNGEIKLRASTIQKKSVIECVGGIKEIMIKHREELFLEEFEKAGDATRKAELIYNTLKESPDRIVEGVCLSGIICIVCIRLMLSAESAVAFVPKLAIFAMGAFKLLPCVGKLASRMNAILYYMPGLNNVYRNYKEVEEYETEKRVLQEHVIAVGQQPDTFHETLSINHVFWQYTEGSAPILTDANLTIHRGESIAFIGSSGSGKTTLLNILLGLMKPLKGTVEMDGVDIYRIPQTWGRIVGCVPQFVYLADESIRRNIAFGIREDDIDDHVIWDVLEKVQLTPFVEALPAGLDTIVGERGIKFSGGQRQRIALARALYDAPEILILDEATASLDNETEAAVMEAIELLQGQITLIIVAHRLTTIKNCDHIYEVGNGVITERSKESVLSNITLDGREETK